MREIPLTKGRVALVDDADYEWLNQWKWHLTGVGYAGRMDQKDGKRILIHMHRAILGLTDSLTQGDHRNHNRIDNQRANLRKVTRAENQQNRRGAQANSATGVRGVSWDRRLRKYEAHVTVSGHMHHLGLFASLSEADTAAQQGRSRLMTHSTN